jgi:hypothetical protein
MAYTLPRAGGPVDALRLLVGGPGRSRSAPDPSQDQSNVCRPGGRWKCLDVTAASLNEPSDGTGALRARTPHADHGRRPWRLHYPQKPAAVAADVPKSRLSAAPGQVL